jgi:hypothetical protein
VLSEIVILQGQLVVSVYAPTVSPWSGTGNGRLGICLTAGEMLNNSIVPGSVNLVSKL